MMRLLMLCAAVAPSIALVSLHASAQAAPPPLVIENVTVVPMDSERILPNQTVVVRDGRIAFVGDPSRAPRVDGARRVAGAGKFLIPGLAEMHAHLPPRQAPPEVTRRVLELFVLNGVTQVRGMLGDPLHLELRRQVETGEVLGPRIMAGGPSLNGQSVPTPEAAVQAVQAQKAAGYDLLKIHPGVRRDVFDALATAADRAGIRFAGHVPYDVGVRRAIEARFASIEHLDGFLEALVPPARGITPAEVGFFGSGVVDKVDLSLLPALVASAKANNVWMAPTEVLMVNMASEEPVERMLERPEYRYWLPAQLTQWATNTRALRANDTITPVHRARFLELRRTLIAALHDGGVGFILASDAPQMWNVPGFSVVGELRALVAAGLTPYEALRSGTVNIATYMGIASEAGTVAQGKRADLVLLEGNPLTDIGAVARPAGVVLRGRWIDREEIDRRLAALEIPR